MAIVRGSLPLNHYRGDAYTIHFTVFDVDETTGVKVPVDITDFDIRWVIRTSAVSDDPDDVIIRPIVEKLTPFSNGQFQWVISPDVSDLIGTRNGVYDIELATTDDNGNDIERLTFLTGTWIVTQDVTRPATATAARVLHGSSIPKQNSIEASIAKARQLRKTRR